MLNYSILLLMNVPSTHHKSRRILILFPFPFHERNLEGERVRVSNRERERERVTKEIGEVFETLRNTQSLLYSPLFLFRTK